MDIIYIRKNKMFVYIHYNYNLSIYKNIVFDHILKIRLKKLNIFNIKEG